MEKVIPFHFDNHIYVTKEDFHYEWEKMVMMLVIDFDNYALKRLKHSCFNRFSIFFSYGGFFLYCRKEGDLSLVTTLSVSTHHTSLGPNKIILHSIPATKPREDNIVACVSPSHRKIDETHLITWIEMFRLYGVNHFTFYNFSLPTKVDKVLGHYLENDIVTVLEWHTKTIPVSRDTRWPPIRDELYYFGQIEAFNDCLYRWTNRYKYIAFVDLFGVLTPRGRKTLSRVMKFTRSRYKTENIDVYEFYVTYFRRNYRLETIVNAHPVLSERGNVFFERSYHDKIFTSKTRLPRFIIQGDNVKVFSLQKIIQTWKNPFKNVLVPSKYGSLFYYDDHAAGRRPRRHGRLDSNHRKLIRRLLKKVDNVINSIHLS